MRASSPEENMSDLTAGVWPTAPTENAASTGATIIPLRIPKPNYQAPNLSTIPDLLKAEPNWVVWRAEQPKPGKLKWRKVPYTPLAFIPSKADHKKNSAAP